MVRRALSSYSMGLCGMDIRKIRLASIAARYKTPMSGVKPGPGVNLPARMRPETLARTGPLVRYLLAVQQSLDRIHNPAWRDYC